jgi:hypothetical protein
MNNNYSSTNITPKPTNYDWHPGGRTGAWYRWNDSKTRKVYAGPRAKNTLSRATLDRTQRKKIYNYAKSTKDPNLVSKYIKDTYAIPDPWASKWGNWATSRQNK